MSELSRLRWRCRRGIKEMDIILQSFLDQTYPELSNNKKIIFENPYQTQRPKFLRFNFKVANLVVNKVWLRRITNRVTFLLPLYILSITNF